MKGETGDMLIIIAAHHAHHAHQAAQSSGSNSLITLAVVGFLAWIVGLRYGRKRGLKHLGAVELATRWANVQRHRPW
ncbi:MAG: hypothetical protein ACM3ML_21410 [Micromonosporaceae bacterium]